MNPLFLYEASITHAAPMPRDGVRIRTHRPYDPFVPVMWTYHRTPASPPEHAMCPHMLYVRSRHRRQEPGWFQTLPKDLNEVGRESRWYAASDDAEGPAWLRPQARPWGAATPEYEDPSWNHFQPRPVAHVAPPSYGAGHADPATPPRTTADAEPSQAATRTPARQTRRSTRSATHTPRTSPRTPPTYALSEGPSPKPSPPQPRSSRSSPWMEAVKRGLETATSAASTPAPSVPTTPAAKRTTAATARSPTTVPATPPVAASPEQRHPEQPASFPSTPLPRRRGTTCDSAPATQPSTTGGDAPEKAAAQSQPTTLPSARPTPLLSKRRWKSRPSPSEETPAAPAPQQEAAPRAALSERFVNAATGEAASAGKKPGRPEREAPSDEAAADDHRVYKRAPPRDVYMALVVEPVTQWIHIDAKDVGLAKALIREKALGVYSCDRGYDAGHFVAIALIQNSGQQWTTGVTWVVPLPPDVPEADVPAPNLWCLADPRLRRGTKTDEFALQQMQALAQADLDHVRTMKSYRRSLKDVTLTKVVRRFDGAKVTVLYTAPCQIQIGVFAKDLFPTFQCRVWLEQTNYHAVPPQKGRR